MRSADPLHGIAVFLAVARHLSFTKAADALAMSRPTVSSHVDALERRLGVRLLHRSTRHLALTEAGAAFMAGLSDVVDRVHVAERAAIRHQQAPVGRLRVSAPPDLGALHLVPMISEFLKQNPEIEIELDLSNAAVNLIEERFDLAVRGTINIDENLITRRIGQSPLVICAAPDYLAEFGTPERPEDLAGHRCIHFSRFHQGRSWEMRRGEDRRRVSVGSRFEVNDGQGVGHAAVLGLGVALLPGFVVGQHLRAGRLVAVLSDWRVADVPLHAVYPDNRFIAIKVKKFVDFLAAEFRQHPDLSGR